MSNTEASGSLVPLFLVFLSGLGFSIQSLIIKLLSIDGFEGSFQCVASRGVVQLLMSSLLMYHDHRTKADKGMMVFGNSRNVSILLLLRAVIGYGGIAFSFLSMERLPIGDATVLCMLSPFFAAILGVFILREPWGVHEFLATVISLVGAVLVARPTAIFGHIEGDGGTGGSKDTLGITYAFIAAVTSAGAYITVRMLGTTHKMPWANVCFSQAIAQIVLSVPSMYIAGQKVDLNLSRYSCTSFRFASSLYCFTFNRSPGIEPC